jgi:L-alanine-DL-glutamate epimerase-like enolase superfamily enzyme
MVRIRQHLAPATPNAPLLEDILWMRHIFVEPATVEDGYFKIPRRPGAARQIKPEACEQFRVQ